jgi:hypothetical protein
MYIPTPEAWCPVQNSGAHHCYRHNLDTRAGANVFRQLQQRAWANISRQCGLPINLAGARPLWASLIAIDGAVMNGVKELVGV